MLTRSYEQPSRHFPRPRDIPALKNRRAGSFVANLGAMSLAILVQAAQADPGQQPRPVLPYEQAFTEKAKNPPFSYDIHAWVYPGSSARRFQMPVEWADDGLEGTLVLAYRVEWLTGQRCGYKTEPGCRRRVRCVLDAYFDQPSGLPFRNALEVNHDTFGGEGSAHWLTAQSEAEFNEIEALRQSVTLAGPVNLVYRTRLGGVETIEINTFQYERRMYDLDQVSFQIPCSFAARLDSIDRPVRIEIGAAIADAQALDAAARRLETADDPDGAVDPSLISRAITIPQGFFPRWRAHHDEYMAWEEGYHDTFASAPWRPVAYEPSDYEGRFTPAGGGPFDRDIHVWTYTQDFARRFGMPGKWIAKESLGDAVALAFRVERDVAGVCGAGFDLKNCRRFERCMWDIYLPDDAPIPWYVDWPVSNIGGGRQSSVRFLQENDRSKLEAAKEVQHLAQYIHGGDRDAYKRMTAPIAWQHEQRFRKALLGISYWSPWNWRGGVGMRVWTHERRVSGLQLLSVTANCVSRRAWERTRDGERFQSRDYRILFAERGTDWIELDRWMDERRLERPDYLVEVSIPREFEYRWLDHQTMVLWSDKRIERMLTQ